jgi:hypothetical protein
VTLEIDVKEAIDEAIRTIEDNGVDLWIDTFPYDPNKAKK